MINQSLINAIGGGLVLMCVMTFSVLVLWVVFRPLLNSGVWGKKKNSDDIGGGC